MSFIGKLGIGGFKKEAVLNTPELPPTTFIPFIPPETFSTAIALLESKGVFTNPDTVQRTTQGAGEVKGAKIKYEINPDTIGHFLMAAFGADVVTGAGPDYVHTFKRASVVQLPTYTYWFKKADKYPHFSGCMLSKLIIEAKPKELITADAEFVGMKYQGYDAGGAVVVPSYSARVPFAFQNAVVKIDGVQVNDYANLRIELDNMVETEHTLNNDIYPGKISSNGFRPMVSMDLIFENDTQYQKFIANTETKVEIIFTHPDSIPTTIVKYALTLTLPKVNYLTAPFQLNDGLIRIPFAGVGRYYATDLASVTATLVNDAAAAY
jgi:hypothetical protein